MVAQVFDHPVRRRREALGLSQSELGRVTGLRRENLCRLEAGKTATRRGPDARTIRDLASALRVDLQVLEDEITAWLAARA